MRRMTEDRSNRRGGGPAARPDGGRQALRLRPRAALLIFIGLPWLLAGGTRAFAEDSHVLVLPEIVIGGEKNQAYGTACRQPDGSWKIQS